MTSYQQIYDRFLNKVTSYKLLELSDQDIQEMLYHWLMSSIPKFRRCKTDLSLRDDDVLAFKADLLDIEKEILALLMVNEWLEPQINSELYVSQFYGGKEEKFYAQQNHLNTLMSLKESNHVEAQKLMRDYAYQTTIWEANEQ